MSNERIDLEAIEIEYRNACGDSPYEEWDVASRIPKLIAELKRCYEKEDRLRSLVSEAWGSSEGPITVADDLLVALIRLIN